MEKQTILIEKTCDLCEKIIQDEDCQEVKVCEGYFYCDLVRWINIKIKYEDIGPQEKRHLCKACVLKALKQAVEKIEREI